MVIKTYGIPLNMAKKTKRFQFTEEQLDAIKSREDLLDLLKEKSVDINPVQSVIEYEEELQQLQVELLKLQNWIHLHKKRVVVVFEGRDAAGKGGAIRRFTRYLNPRSMRVVALNVGREKLVAGYPDWLDTRV